MAVPIITKGATTNHGGVVEECFETFTIDGKKVHLDGMKHYCPKCKKEVTAIASNHTKTMMGKAWVLEGDKASCGAKFIANQGMAFVGGGDNINGNLAQNLSKVKDEESQTASQRYQLIDNNNGNKLINIPYEIYKNGKLYINGISDADGLTETIFGLINDEIEVYIIESEDTNEFCCKP